MSMQARSQGRPGRGDSAVGRARLLEKTRDALKIKPKVDMQRREIALIAGVTPALVSYYYPDKWDLLAAAAKPVVETYTEGVRTIMCSKDQPHFKILSLTHLFIDFNFRHGYLLDFYLENTAKMARQEDLQDLQDIYGEMIAFFSDLLRNGLIRGDSPAFIQSSLWGLCKSIAQQPHLAHLADSVERDRLLRAQAERVCELFLNGAATPVLFEKAGVTLLPPPVRPALA